MNQHPTNEKNSDIASRRTANATVWIAAFTVVLAVVSFLTLLTLKRQLDEMRKGSADTHNLAVAAASQADWTKTLAERMEDQANRTKDIANQTLAEARATNKLANASIRSANIAERQLNLSQRAWVSVTLASGPNRFHFSQRDAWSQTFTITLRNSGNIPATNVEMRTSTYMAPASSYDRVAPLREQSKLCDHVKPSDDKNSLITIFPGNSTDLTDSNAQLLLTVVAPLKHGQAAKHEQPKISKEVIPTIVGCVLYKSGSLSESHQTRFILEVFRKNPKFPMSVASFVDGEDVPDSDVFFRPFRQGGSYAN
jgi:hypothetical protein